MEDNNGGVLFNTLQSDVAQKERENMNLKMEIAHLRERLNMRVGGETTAIELEAENFTLKKSLMETQEDLAQHQDILREMDGRYSKAMTNVVKLDQAWKKSIEELHQAQEKEEQLHTIIREIEEELNIKNEEYETELTNIKTLFQCQEETIADLQEHQKQKLSELDSKNLFIEQFQLQKKELQSQIEEMRKQNDGSNVANKKDLEQMEVKLQQTVEQCATLRGESTALHEEVQALQTQLIELTTAHSALSSKLLQLKEENATLQVHLTASKKKNEQQTNEIVFLQSEIERLLKEIRKREDKMLQVEKMKQDLETQVSRQQKTLEDTEQNHDQVTKQLENIKQKEWQEKQLVFERGLTQVQQQTEEYKEKYEQLKKKHQEIVRLLLGSSNNKKSNLKELVTEEITKNELLQKRLEQTKIKLEKQDKIQTRIRQLEIENEELKVQYIKAKQAMERIVLRKNKSLSSNANARSLPSSQNSQNSSQNSQHSLASSSSSLEDKENTEPLFQNNQQNKRKRDEEDYDTKDDAIKRKVEDGTAVTTVPIPSYREDANCSSTDTKPRQKTKHVVVESRYLKRYLSAVNR